MPRIVLVRHGVAFHNLWSEDGCEYDAAHRDQLYDAHLTPAGRRETAEHAADVFRLFGRARNVDVYTSPLRRCLQTCRYTLEHAPATFKLSAPRPTPLLVEFSDDIESDGHTIEHLQHYFHGFDWSHFYAHDDVTSPWWKRTYRTSPSRVRRLREFLREAAARRSLLAFSHGYIIYKLSGIHVHNNDAVYSNDGGRTWSHLTFGKSASRLRHTRRRRC